MVEFKIELTVMPKTEIAVEDRKNLDKHVLDVLQSFSDILFWEVKTDHWDFYKSDSDEMHKIYTSGFRYTISKTLKSMVNYHCFSKIAESVFELLQHDDDFLECHFSWKLY